MSEWFGRAERVERLQALLLFRAGAWGVCGAEEAGSRARDGVSGRFLREALLFGMDERAAREVL